MEERRKHSARDGFLTGGMLGSAWEADGNDEVLSYLTKAQKEIDVEIKRALDLVEALHSNGSQNTIEYQLLMERLRCLRWFNGERDEL